MRTIAGIGAALGVMVLFSCAAASRDAGASSAPSAPCAGLADRDVEDAVAAIKSNIESIAPKYEVALGAKGVSAQRLDGVVLRVRALPGVTAPWLARVLTCDARRAVPAFASGPDRAPLALAGAQVSAAESDTGFAVAIVARDAEVAREIERRSQELSRPTGR